MVFKLVRCDAVESYKIQLPIGKHLIGRGKFLECEDKRISRHHGELEVTEDSVIIKALHQNPCFYLKKGTSATQILKHDCFTSLSNGDRFGLLPDAHWYEVLLCNLKDISHSPEVHTENTKDAGFEQNGDEVASDKTIFGSDITEEEIQKEISENSNARSPKTRETVKNDHVGNEQPEFPSLLPPENQSSTQEYQLSEQQLTDDNSTEPPVEHKSPSNRNHEQDRSENGEELKRIKVEPQSPLKRNHEQDNPEAGGEIKRIKEEPKDIKPGPSNNQNGGDSNSNAMGGPLSPAKTANNSPLRERCMYDANSYRNHEQDRYKNGEELKRIKVEPQSPLKRNHEQDSPEAGGEIKGIKEEPEDIKPGPSNNQNGADSNSNAMGGPPSPAKTANNGLLRERCMYGANCYRRNPQHKVQFSHPTDSDWGMGERGVCPWGTGCARLDPRHWRDHEHPPGVRPPTQNRPGKEKKKRKARVLSPESDLIVTGKRARKTIKRPSWSGSESENEYDIDDPFLTDGSDEWEPPSDISESQDFSQETLDY